MKDKKNGGMILIAAGVLLIATALTLAGHNLYEEYQAGKTAQNVAQALRQQITEAAEAQGDSTPEDLHIADYVVDPDMEMPTENVAEYDYIGILDIPALGLSLPIMEKWSYSNLKITPCRYSGSAYTGNFTIAGHNYSTHFGRLKTLTPGTQLSFTDTEGRSFVYEVQAVETLETTAVEDMLSDEWDLTLFTCTTSGQARVAVRCLKTD